jgi:hypothetical protein
MGINVYSEDGTTEKAMYRLSNRGATDPRSVKKHSIFSIPVAMG